MSSLYKLLLNTENTDKYISEKYSNKNYWFLDSLIIFSWIEILSKGYVKKIISLEFKNFRNFIVVILHASNILDIKKKLVQMKTSHLEFASD